MIPQKDRIEAAIRHIQTSADIDPWAMELAVDAMKAQATCGDAVSRQAAIDMAVSIPMFGRDVKMVAVGEIKNLPSAQPEIIRCNDCKHWDTSWENNFAPNYHYCPLIDGTRRGDFYCADAERRTDEQ